jgi:hypothetical protein
VIAPPFAHWLLLVTLGFGPEQIWIPTGGFDPISGWDHYQVYRSRAWCERAAGPWRVQVAVIGDPMYSIRCVRYGQRKIGI